MSKKEHTKAVVAVACQVEADRVANEAAQHGLTDESNKADEYDAAELRDL